MSDIIAARTSARTVLPYWSIVAIIALATIATRISAFGNPTYSTDDPIFLLIGQAILDGQIPYVDIWDRKPVGIFIIFAGIRLLGGDGIIESQLVAGLFAAATALTIERICRYFTGQQGSILAGLSYLMFLPMFRGAAAQVSVFYNLFMALAALLVVRSIIRDGPPRLMSCLAAMLLCGLSMTLKQTTAIEGCLFGLTFLVIGYRRGWSVNQIASNATLMLIAALLPTLLSFGVFAWLGQLDAYWFAAFESNSLRGTEDSSRLFARGLSLGKLSIPFAIVALWGAVSRHRGGGNEINIFILAWLAFAVVSLVTIPLFYFYYFTPVLLPLSISAATILDRRQGGLLTFSILFLCVIAQGSILSRSKSQRAQGQYRTLSKAVESNLKGGCLYVANGPPSLYLTSGACRLSRFVFPRHLISSMEAHAVPVDSQAEFARILSQHPQVIVFDTLPDGEYRNKPNVRALRTALAQDYVRVGRFPQLSDDEPHLFDVWARRDDVHLPARN